MQFQEIKLDCGLNTSKNNSVFLVLTLNLIVSSLFCKYIKTNQQNGIVKNTTCNKEIITIHFNTSKILRKAFKFVLFCRFAPTRNCNVQINPFR